MAFIAKFLLTLYLPQPLSHITRYFILFTNTINYLSFQDQSLVESGTSFSDSSLQGTPAGKVRENPNNDSGLGIKNVTFQNDDEKDMMADSP